jgi:hypothetical protein
MNTECSVIKDKLFRPSGAPSPCGRIVVDTHTYIYSITMISGSLPSFSFLKCWQYDFELRVSHVGSWLEFFSQEAIRTPVFASIATHFSMRPTFASNDFKDSILDFSEVGMT